MPPSLLTTAVMRGSNAARYSASFAPSEWPMQPIRLPVDVGARRQNVESQLRVEEHLGHALRTRVALPEPPGLVLRRHPRRLRPQKIPRAERHETPAGESQAEVLLRSVRQSGRLTDGLGHRRMKDNRAWPSSSRPARHEDERLGLNVRFNQVPHTLANNVTDAILRDDLEGRRACCVRLRAIRAGRATPARGRSAAGAIRPAS